LVSNIIVLIGAGLIGWFLAGEPTNIKELKSGIGHLFGGGGGGGDMMGAAGGGMMPYGPMGGMMPPVGGNSSDPQVQALQQQMQQQAQQSQMEKMQQQFTDQMSQQQAQAQQAQLQQQIQQMQMQQQQQAAAAAGGMGSAAAATGAPQSPLNAPATATPSAADAAQQMLPSAIPPGIVPGMQQQQLSTPGSPYDPNSYVGQYGGAGGGYPGMGSQLGPDGMPMPALPGGPPPWLTPGYGGGGYPYPPPTHMIDNLFAGHFAPPLGPINIQGPLRAIPNHTVFHGEGGHGYHRGFLGIVDTHEKDRTHVRARPFFNGYHDLMRIDLGPIIPGLEGIVLGDLIASTDSGTGNEIFPIGIDKFNRDTFMNDITRYIYRILRNMTGKSPDDKMRILRELILEASRAKGISAYNPIPPDVVTYQNILSSVPRSRVPDIIPMPHGPRYRNHDGYSIPDKYAALQFKGGNSMPPMLRRGHGGGDDGHSLFFNLNER
jgi:hypothetical protein